MTDDINQLFADRVKREREERGWSLRDLAQKAGGISVSTVHRAERGDRETWLSMAAQIATALGIPIGDLVSTPVCETCDGKPPAGFTCRTCGRSAS